MTTIHVDNDVLITLKRIKREKRKKSLDDVLRLLIASYDTLNQIQAQNNNIEIKEDANNPYEFAQKNPCPYRTIVKTKGGFYVLCAETKKIPIEACVTRQKRYLKFEKKCFPIALKKIKSKPQKPMKTKIYRDEFESAYYPNDDYYNDTWGDYF